MWISNAVPVKSKEFIGTTWFNLNQAETISAQLSTGNYWAVVAKYPSGQSFRLFNPVETRQEAEAQLEALMRKVVLMNGS